MRSSGHLFLRGQSGKDDVLFDVQAAEDAPLLVHELHAEPRDAVALQPDELDAVELDRCPCAARDDAHQALQRRALARAVPAEKRDRLVLLDAQRDVEEDVALAVVAVERR